MSPYKFSVNCSQRAKAGQQLNRRANETAQEPGTTHTVGFRPYPKWLSFNLPWNLNICFISFLPNIQVSIASKFVSFLKQCHFPKTFVSCNTASWNQTLSFILCVPTRFSSLSYLCWNWTTKPRTSPLN